jgi:2-polyprenyl-3-methyl-5-hydroxy-6-metoxy-1,4-benzoquinol methylase/glycosyltransferase involved in cell wall biosynthesis
MNTTEPAPLNSRSWWEDYFARQWDEYGGRDQTTYFMRRLIESLPPAENEYLSLREASVLDWGCAFGNGVDVLGKTFPRCRPVGIDFAKRAVAEARRLFPQYEFQHTERGEIAGKFDVIVTSNCLEHFDDPVALIRQHLQSCGSFYAAMVPYREAPLHPSHVAQFREECFPEQIGGFARIAAVVVDCGVPCWPGKQLLVLYGSHSYLQEREAYARRAEERRKWDDYYAVLPMFDDDGAARGCSEDLAERLLELLPAESRVLEAGCGSGWQSLLLARSGKLQLTLMDFSQEALACAKRSFAERSLSADFVCQDVFAPGEAQYDLVFNAGALANYAFDEQVAFLRGMASRSRKYVLAVSPNPTCYWYWVWRMQRSSRGEWPFGKEAPIADLATSFQAAGLTFLGQMYGDGRWSESFLKGLDGLDDSLREELLALHRTAAIPEQWRAPLLVGLGCKGEASEVPTCWRKPPASLAFSADSLTASLADALAASVAAERRLKRFEATLAEKQQQWNCECAAQKAAAEEKDRQWQRQLAVEKEACDTLAGRLDAIENSRGYRALQSFWQTKARLVPSGSIRHKTLKAGWKSLHGDFAYLRRLAPAKTCRAAAARVGLWLAPQGSLRERCLRKATQKAHWASCRVVSQPGMDLADVLRQCEDRKGIIVYPPFIDWSWMRQRPHQLMTQFAQAGYLSLFCSPKCRSDLFRGFVRLDARLYLCDSLDPLYDLPHPILLIGWTGHWPTIQRFRSPLLIYDYLDDLSVSAHHGVPDQKKLDLHNKMASSADVVLATARRLHDEVRRLRPDALYCPNGVTYEDFHLTSPPPVPADIADVVQSGRPIVGYYGALARWFDYELLAEAARKHPSFEFVLVGPNFDRSLLPQPLIRLPNVRWLGQKQYEDLPAYLYYFTVATIPFVINDITTACSPAKLFEYMAGGKPIVTTDMPECREYTCVMVARNASEYVAMLDEAACRGKWESYQQAINRDAQANTWRARAEQILARVEEVAASRRHSARASAA